MANLRLSYAIVLITCVAGASTPHGQNLDIKGETERLIALLELTPGAVVADVGAGSTGDLTFEMARQLGAMTRIYSTEIPSRVQALRDNVASAGVANVTVLEGHPTQTNLPDACCDAIFVRHVYHHFGDPAAMNASITRALKPGGRFAVMDFPPNQPGTGVVPPELRATGDTHGATKETVVAELKEAGFEIVTVLPEWPGQLYLVLARRPSVR